MVCHWTQTIFFTLDNFYIAFRQNVKYLNPFINHPSNALCIYSPIRIKLNMKWPISSNSRQNTLPYSTSGSSFISNRLSLNNNSPPRDVPSADNSPLNGQGKDSYESPNNDQDSSSRPYTLMTGSASESPMRTPESSQAISNPPAHDGASDIALGAASVMPKPSQSMSSNPVTTPTQSTPLLPSSYVRKPRSWVWLHFTRHYENDDINKGFVKATINDPWNAVCKELFDDGTQCTFTKQSEKLKGGTTGVLLRHLESYHSYNRNGQKSATTAFIPRKSTTVKSNPKNAGEINDSFVDLIINAGLPFSIGENLGFRQFLDQCGASTANLIEPDAIIHSVYEKHQNICSKIQRKLEQSCETIALTLDIWDSPNGYAILAVTGTWLDANFEFCRELLHFNEIIGGQDGATLASSVFEILVKFKLCGKLISITGFNVINSNICVELESLLSEWATNKHATVRFSSCDKIFCFVHVINLACYTLLKSIDDGTTESAEEAVERANKSEILAVPEDVGSVQTLRMLVLWINHRAQRKEKWRTFSRKCLDSDVSTDWKSTYKMISTALEVRDDLTRFVLECKELQKIKLDYDYWKSIVEIRDALDVFKSFISRVSEEDSPLYFGLHYYTLLSTVLQDIYVHEPSSVTLRAAADKALKLLRKYISVMKETDIYYITSVLNPGIKTRHIKKENFFFDSDVIVNRIKRNLKRDYPEEPSTRTREDTPSDIESERHSMDKRSMDSFLPANFRNGGYSNPDVNDEIERYFTTASVESVETDSYQLIRNWWNSNQETYPRMALIARHYLSIPLSEIDTGRLISYGKYWNEIQRHTLNPEILNAFMMVKAYNNNRTDMVDEGTAVLK